MFEERDHVHTQMYDYQWGAFRDADGVPPELALDHRFAGLVTVFGEVADGVEPDALHQWFRDEHLPERAGRLTDGDVPGRHAQAAADRPRRRAPGRGLRPAFRAPLLLRHRPRAAWADHFADHAAVLEKSGLGRIPFASPFLTTIPGTDTYTDQLW